MTWKALFWKEYREARSMLLISIGFTTFMNLVIYFSNSAMWTLHFVRNYNLELILPVFFILIGVNQLPRHDRNSGYTMNLPLSTFKLMFVKLVVIYVISIILALWILFFIPEVFPTTEINPSGQPFFLTESLDLSFPLLTIMLCPFIGLLCITLFTSSMAAFVSGLLLSFATGMFVSTYQAHDHHLYVHFGRLVIDRFTLFLLAVLFYLLYLIFNTKSLRFLNSFRRLRNAGLSILIIILCIAGYTFGVDPVNFYLKGGFTYPDNTTFSKRLKILPNTKHFIFVPYSKKDFKFIGKHNGIDEFKFSQGPQKINIDTLEVTPLYSDRSFWLEPSNFYYSGRSPDLSEICSHSRNLIISIRKKIAAQLEILYPDKSDKNHHLYWSHCRNISREEMEKYKAQMILDIDSYFSENFKKNNSIESGYSNYKGGIKSRVFFLSDAGTREVLDILTSNLKYVSVDTFQDELFVLLPNGENELNHELFYFKHGNSKLIKIYHEPILNESYRPVLSVSPDGNFLIVSDCYYSYKSALRFLKRNSPEWELAFKYNAGSYHTRKWSPDSKYLCVRNESENLVIISVPDLDSDITALVFSEIYGVDWLKWSPDSSALAFRYYPNNGKTKYLSTLQIESGRISRLQKAQHIKKYKWIDDNRLVIHEEHPDHHSLIITDFEGKSKHRIFPFSNTGTINKEVSP